PGGYEPPAKPSVSAASSKPQEFTNRDMPAAMSVPASARPSASAPISSAFGPMGSQDSRRSSRSAAGRSSQGEPSRQAKPSASSSGYSGSGAGGGASGAGFGAVNSNKSFFDGSKKKEGSAAAPGAAPSGTSGAPSYASSAAPAFDEESEETLNDLRQAENLLGGNPLEKPGRPQRDVLELLLRFAMLLAGLLAFKNRKLAYLLGLRRTT
ncbi:MAG TPA: hypothetical protein DCM05_15130, partial [Elusimicrobia bacterium]|nr:hypothetical protein [Elusimicrobiota bacterium]